MQMKTEKESEKIEMVLVGRLVPSPTNPRKDFDAEEMESLKRSIDALGIQEALIVRPHPQAQGLSTLREVVAGHRRLRAAAELGLNAVPCVVRRDLTDEEVLEIQLVENVQRVGLSVVEECAGVEALAERGMDAGKVSAVTGKSVHWVQERLDFKLAPEAMKEAVTAGFCGLGSVSRILKVEDKAKREELAQDVLRLEETLSDREIEVMIQERYEKPKENREAWKRWVSTVSGLPEFAGVMFLEDPADWSQYVRPYGEAVAPYKLESDRVGGLAARDEDAGVKWGQLAKVHGVPLLVVPVGGYQEGCGNVVRLVDRGPVESAERARKDAGESYTLGAKGKRGGGEPEKEGPVEEEVMEDLDNGELVTRESLWNPWLMLGMEMKAEQSQSVRVAVDVLELENPGWREYAEARFGIERGEFNEFMEREFETILPVVVWYCLEGLDANDRRGLRLASAFGVRELWEGRGA